MREPGFTCGAFELCAKLFGEGSGHGHVFAPRFLQLVVCPTERFVEVAQVAGVGHSGGQDLRVGW